MLKINKKGEPPGKGERDYSFLYDAFKQMATGIECVVCGPGPGGFSFTWDDIDPDGTQRQLKKGNLALHVEKNQKHRERVKVAANKASRKAREGGRFISYFQRASAPPPSPPPLHPLSAAGAGVVGGSSGGAGDIDAVGVSAAAAAGGGVGETGEEPQEQQPPVLEASGGQGGSGSSLEVLRELVAGCHRCIGYLSLDLAGTKRLLIDAPVAPFYPNSSIGKISLCHRIELRANGFFAKKSGSLPGCHVVVERENQTSEACESLDYVQALNQVLSICEEPPKTTSPPTVTSVTFPSPISRLGLSIKNGGMGLPTWRCAVRTRQKSAARARTRACWYRRVASS